MNLLRLLLAFASLLFALGAQGQPVAAPGDTLFAVQFTTGPKWDPTLMVNDQPFFAEHSANLGRMRRKGALVIGARYGEVGLVVLRLPDEAAVRAQLAKDPSIEAGTFSARIDPFRPFMHGSTQAPLATGEGIVLRAYYDAFNRHDADATAVFLAEDVKWFGITGDTQLLAVEGREAVRDWLTGYFKNLPTVRSEVLEMRQTGPHVFVHERVSWTGDDGKPNRQSALAVQEVREEQIRRVWYFPPEDESRP